MFIALIRITRTIINTRAETVERVIDHSLCTELAARPAPMYPSAQVNPDTTRARIEAKMMEAFFMILLRKYD